AVMSFFFELLPNVKSLTCHMDLPVEMRLIISSTALSTCNVQRCASALSYQGGAVTFYPDRASPSPSLRVPLPIPVDFNDAVISSTPLEGSAEVVLKAPVRAHHLPSAEDDSASTPVFGARWMKDLRRVRCHSCGSDLVRELPGEQNTRFKRVLDLPSEHWHELLDSWACHLEDYSFLRRGHVGSVIPASEGECLVGGVGQLLLNGLDVASEAVDFNAARDEGDQDGDRSSPDVAVVSSHVKSDGDVDVDNELDHASTGGARGEEKHKDAESLETYRRKAARALRPLKWAPVSCGKCRTVLGESLQYKRENDEEVTVDVVNTVFKFWRYTVDVELNSRIIGHQPFSSYIGDLMSESANAHAVYKFVLYPRALKVLYIDCRENADSSAGVLATWATDKTLEKLPPFEGLFIEDLLRTLKGSTAAMPRALRTMNGFSIAQIPLDLTMASHLQNSAVDRPV
ncbi:hypothetical protein HK101_009345, partial [Irineochytrium annulatum]